MKFISKYLMRLWYKKMVNAEFFDIFGFLGFIYIIIISIWILRNKKFRVGSDYFINNRNLGINNRWIYYN